jgi:hypothetical protein
MNGNTIELYLNYTVPILSQNATWITKFYNYSTSLIDYTNFSINDSVLENNELKLKIVFEWGDTDIANYYVYYGSAYKKIYVDLNVNRFYEEAIIWKSYGYLVNFTALGNTTPIHHFTNVNNVTGSHTYKLNSTGYWDWANYTGNGSSGVSSYLVNIKLNGVVGFINWSGYYNSTSENISFNVTSNATITGTADVNVSDDYLYIAGFDIEPTFLLISILFALFYFWWKAESMGMMYLMTMLLI